MFLLCIPTSLNTFVSAISYRRYESCHNAGRRIFVSLWANCVLWKYIFLFCSFMFCFSFCCFCFLFCFVIFISAYLYVIVGNECLELFAWACANMYRIDTDAYKLNFCLCVDLTDAVANAVDVRKLNAVWSNNRYDIDLFLMKSKNVCNISVNSQCEIKWNIYHFIPRFLNEQQWAKAWYKYELGIALNFASSFWSFSFWAAVVEELAVKKNDLWQKFSEV